MEVPSFRTIFGIPERYSYTFQVRKFRWKPSFLILVDTVYSKKVQKKIFTVFYGTKLWPAFIKQVNFIKSSSRHPAHIWTVFFFFFFNLKNKNFLLQWL